MVENTHALRSIRMEGMRFCKQNKEFCMQIRMDGKLSQTELSGLKLLSIFDLASCFPLFLVLGSNVKSFPNLEIVGNSCCCINVRVLAKIRYNPCKYWCFGIYFGFKILAFGYNGWVLKENMPCCALEVSITTRPS